MFDRVGGRKYLNWPEREAFCRVVKNEADPLKRALCLTLFYTGARVSEALGLTWERVDFTGEALIFETLKRRKRGFFRPIPIPRSLVAELKDLETPAGATGRVWAVSRPTAYRWIKEKMTEAGITGAKACPKGLRHSFAVACLTRNVPITVLRRWLGHARLETTSIYLDLMGEDDRQMAMRLWRSA